MEEQDYEEEFLRDIAIIKAEREAQMEADWREMEEYDNQLPAKIIVEIKIPKENETT